jgi:hypothetical protein
VKRKGCWSWSSVRAANLLARSNLGRRMVFVQEGKVLGTALIEKPETSGKVQLLGPLPDMRRIFKELTEPKPK